VRGAGLPSLRGRPGRSGDLRVVVNVVVPRHLTKEQQELYDRLAATMTEHNLNSGEGVFGKLRRAFGG
jgi:molecular chaperone DnaJ